MFYIIMLSVIFNILKLSKNPIYTFKLALEQIGFKIKVIILIQI